MRQEVRYIGSLAMEAIFIAVEGVVGSRARKRQLGRANELHAILQALEHQADSRYHERLAPVDNVS